MVVRDRKRARGRRVAAALAVLGAGAAVAALVVRPHGGDDRTPPAGSDARGPVAGETYRWRPVAIGGGGFVTGLASDVAGRTRVVRTDVYGAYRWDDARDRWVQLVTEASMPAPLRTQNGMGQGVYEIAVAPGDARRLYMAVKGQMLRSDDGGATWTMPADGGPFPMTFDPNAEFRRYGPFLGVSPDDPDLVLFGAPEGGLWRSQDGGRHWTHVASVPASADLRPTTGIQAPGPLIWFDPSRTAGRARRVIVASAGHGLYASADGGVNFTPLAPAGTPQPTTVARAAIAADGTIIAVDDEAQAVWRWAAGRWRNLTADHAVPARKYIAVALDRTGRRAIVSDEGGSLWCSTDGGNAWTESFHSAAPGAKEPPWLRLTNQTYFASGQIAFDPVAPDRLWTAAGAGPYRADIGAGCPDTVEWRSQVRGIEEIVANDAVQPPGHAPLFAGWDFGIHRKPDLDAFSTGFGPKERMLIAAQQIDWSPSDPRFLVTNASDTRMGCCAEDGDAVLAGYSPDGGQTWRKFASLPQPPGTRADDPWRMSFGTIAVAADRTDNIVWAPAFNRSPFYTLDRGTTWRRVVLPGETLPFTGSFEQFYGARKTLAADRVLPGTFYLVHTGEGANAALRGLWRTRDGGATWSRVFEGLIAPNSNAVSAKLRAVPHHAGHLFFTAGVIWGNDTRLRRSVDGGVHWQALDDVDHVDDVAFGKAAAGAAYPTIIVSGRVRGAYGIWRSVDDARSWQRLAGFPLGRLDQVAVVAADPDVFGRVYVGYTGSGWVYGEPARCRPVAGRTGDDESCERVGGK